LQRYNYDYVVPTIFKFIASSYSQNGGENSLLSEMIDFGKIYYFLEQLLPCTEKHLLIGFKAQEWVDVMANQEIIWANFIENKLLYETSEVTKRKFLGERPVVYEIGDKCPGRIGAWLGWEIVKAYMERTDVSLKELLQETDHHKIFSQSQYKPSNQRN
jgi:hypothetical protein